MNALILSHSRKGHIWDAGGPSSQRHTTGRQMADKCVASRVRTKASSVMADKLAEKTAAKLTREAIAI